MQHNDKVSWQYKSLHSLHYSNRQQLAPHFYIVHTKIKGREGGCTLGHNGQLNRWSGYRSLLTCVCTGRHIKDTSSENSSIGSSRHLGDMERLGGGGESRG